jgi:cyclase
VAAEHPEDTIYIFGHANPAFGMTGSRADLLYQRDFLSAVLQRARRAVAQGQSREEATALERLPGFPDHVAITSWLSLAAPLGAAFDEVSDTR